MDPLCTLPPEVCVSIVMKLSPRDVYHCLLVNKTWNHLIVHCGWIWKSLCKSHCCSRYVSQDAKQGLPWKEIFINNYGKSFVKREWLRGEFSNITRAEIPLILMCSFDTNTWGEILDCEMSR